PRTEVAVLKKSLQDAANHAATSPTSQSVRPRANTNVDSSTGREEQGRDSREEKKTTQGDRFLLLDRETGKLGKSATSRLGLSISEATLLESTLENTRRRIADMSLQAAEIVEQPTVTIKMRPFDGSNVYDDFRNDLDQTIGKERAQQLVEDAKRQIDRIMGSFGAQQRTIQITKELGLDG